jgi:hypothetical protein
MRFYHLWILHIVCVIHLQRNWISLLEMVWQLAAVILTVFICWQLEYMNSYTCFTLSSFFISVTGHLLCELPFSSQSFFSWFKYLCIICWWYIVWSMYSISIIDFQLRGKKIYVSCLGETIFLLCDFIHFCLLGPVMRASPTAWTLPSTVCWVYTCVSSIGPVCHCCCILSWKFF